ncbi:hypothetical protein H0X06_07210 [Candidatus Dependentiae bacterium]|nr:hypothetical protein [Candidatus Dependentiae bacterium]
MANLTSELCLAYTFPLLDESRNLLKCLAVREPFSLSIAYYNDVTSVFHFIVAMVYYLKQKDLSFYEHFLKEGGLSLISWLAAEKVTDEVVSEGKTASQKAAELGLAELSQHIMDEVGRAY